MGLIEGDQLSNPIAALNPKIIKVTNNGRRFRGGLVGGGGKSA